MRRLILMRHAKSDWDRGLSDHDRPLNGRGRREAPHMALHLARVCWVPDAVVLSDAARTRETWGCMAATLDAVQPRATPALYLASPQAILAVAADLPDEAHTALLLGHNPGMSTAASYLAGRVIDLKTATAVLLSHDGDAEGGWGAARDAQGWRLVDVIRARTLYESAR